MGNWAMVKDLAKFGVSANHPARRGEGRLPQLALSALLFAGVLALDGCTVWEKGSGGSASPKSETQPVATTRGEVFYAAEDGMKVYDGPGTSSKVTGKLTRHEKVTRYRVDRGYAFVKAATSGIEGWVDNAKLLWRLRTAPKPVAAGGDPKSAGVTPLSNPADLEADESVAPDPEAGDAQPPAAAGPEESVRPTPGEPEAEPPPTPRGTPALFDPY